MNLLARITAPPETERSARFGWGTRPNPFSMVSDVPVVLSPQDLYEVAELIHDASSVVAGVVAARASVMSQVRFAWRNTIRASGNYRQLFGNAELELLERPHRGVWTRPLLLALLEQHVSYTGSAFVVRHPNRLEVLNPQLVDVVLMGSEDIDQIAYRRAAVKVGYYYWADGRGKPGVPYGLDEVVHWVAEPHPVRWWAGSAWVTSLLEDLAIDKASTRYLSRFFDHAATPNLIVKPHENMSAEQLDLYREIFAKEYAGHSNAFKTMWLGGGSDVTVVGSRLADLDLRTLQGGSETRIAVRSRVPAAILGIREGLAGSALNAGNYAATRRLWADSWFSPAVQSLCAAMESAFEAPEGAEMWHDDADVLLLQEDAKDAAEIMQTMSNALQSLDSAGYQADAAVAAIRDNNLSALIGNHDGNQSVQRAPEPQPGEGDTNARDLAVAEVLQKVYLAVANNVITVDEARLIANQAGASLPVPAPVGLSIPDPEAPSE